MLILSVAIKSVMVSAVLPNVVAPKKQMKSSNPLNGRIIKAANTDEYIFHFIAFLIYLTLHSHTHTHAQARAHTHTNKHIYRHI